MIGCYGRFCNDIELNCNDCGKINSKTQSYEVKKGARGNYNMLICAFYRLQTHVNSLYDYLSDTFYIIIHDFW
jgi:hypothetical protein